MKIYDNENTVKLVDACVKEYIPVLLRGETGTGKTTIVKALAEGASKTLTRINLTGQTSREDLVGKYILREGNLVWQDGPLSTALKQGHWILLDEINAALPEILFVIQALLESDGRLGNVLLVEKDGELLTPHEDCRIFATCNPSDYEGVKDLNMATLSRFVVVDIQPLDFVMEEILLVERYGSKIARKLVVGAAKAREAKEKGETTVFVSTRDLELAARLHKEGIKEDEAIMVAILSKCQDSANRAIITAAFNVDPPKSKDDKTFLQEYEFLKKKNKELTESAKQTEGILEALQSISKKLQST